MRMDRSGRPMLSFVWLDDVAMRIPPFVLMSATQPNSDNRRGATAGRMLSGLSDEVAGVRGVIPHRPINFLQGILFARSRASRARQTAYSQPSPGDPRGGADGCDHARALDEGPLPARSIHASDRR